MVVQIFQKIFSDLPGPWALVRLLFAKSPQGLFTFPLPSRCGQRPAIRG